MDYKYLVTVIIPVYNVQNYLEETVRSVLDQNDARIRILLIDDGSTDKSGAICDQLAKRYGNVLTVHRKNSGQSVSTNYGIQMVLSSMDCKFISFLDSDDAWAPGFFRKIAPILEHEDFVYVGLQSCECNDALSFCARPVPMDESIQNGGRGHVWCHSAQHFGAMFLSTAFAKKYGLGLDEQLVYSNDQVFTIRCVYLARKIRLLNVVMYYRRNNQNSVMAHRKFGATYFEPILDGYLRLNEMLCKDTGSDITLGREIASFRFLEMIKDHLIWLEPLSTLRAFFARRPDLTAIVNEIDHERYARYRSMITRSVSLRRMSYRIYGACRLLLRKAAQKTKLSGYYHRKKYDMPITLVNQEMGK